MRKGVPIKQDSWTTTSRGRYRRYRRDAPVCTLGSLDAKLKTGDKCLKYKANSVRVLLLCDKRKVDHMDPCMMNFCIKGIQE